MFKKLVHSYPGRIVLFSILAAIFTGTLLLMLPIAQTTPLHFIDVLFTATSTTCVCGLMTVPMSSFTPFGHAIIFALMQIGGLGIITLTLMLMSLVANIGLAAQIMAGHIFEFESIAGIKRILSFIVILTLSVELVGALLIVATGYADYSFFHALFHTVASFCNAGLSLEPLGMISHAHDILFLSITMLLIIIGGMGFVTWYDITKKISAMFAHKPYRISLHTKIVLLMFTALTLFVALIFCFIESINPLSALFMAVSCQSTGFLTVNINNLRIATIFMMMLTTFVGSAPGSTGSGIKTTVLAIFLATARTIITGRPAVEMFGRTIPKQQVYKALTIIMLSISWIALITFLLLLSEGNKNFLDICFEAISAFSTLGLSLGITPFLSASGKFFIIASMIIGRIGSLSLVLALTRHRQISEISYPEERIILS